MEFELVVILQILFGLLFVATLVGIAVQRLRMPYTVGLVLVGLGIAIALSRLDLTGADTQSIRGLIIPNLILTILVPPLIFEAAFHIKFDQLRANLRPITAFAIPGVLLTMLLVGGMISLATALPLEVALIFGALIAATDPVAVVALFRTLGVPNQLLVLLEGESLFNDGTAIVIFHLMVAVALGQTEFSTIDFVIDFVVVAGGGIIVGALVSWFLSSMIRLVNNHLIELTFTTIAAYGSYLIAEEFHVSGVLAVVVAGLVIGNIGELGMSPTTRINLFNFWEFAAYLSNSMAFLLIGLVIDLPELIANWQPILYAIIAVLVARAVVIYSLSSRFANIALRMQHVLYWGGLRGAISLALALTLPAELGENQILLQDMTFGVVLFTLLVQGTTMRTVVRQLGFATKSREKENYERQQARAVASQVSYDRLKELRKESLLSDHAWQILEPALLRQIEIRTEVVHEIVHNDPSVEVAELDRAFEEILRAQRSAYNDLFSSGVISEENFSRLVGEVDSARLNEDISYGDLLLRRSKDQPPITKLIFAAINDAEIYEVIHMLGMMGVPTTRLASNIGPSGIAATTLLIGVEEQQVEQVVEAIILITEEPPDFQRGMFNLLPASRQEEKITVDNAQVFVFNVEHYEEL